VLGAILLYSAYLALRNKVSDKEKSKVVEWLSSHLPVTQMTERSEFVVLRNGHLLITPMLIALVAIELSDIAFAVDSIPAAFSVSRKPFVIYTSNVFAILGLRAAYVVLARAITKLKYLNLGLAGVLAFAGLKLTLRNFIRVPALASVAVIVAIIAACVWLSIASMGKNDPLRCDPSRGCISHGNDSLRSNDRNHQQIVWDDRLTHELTERLTSPLRQWGKNC
jgi:tellurite resistance protein TerC